MTGITLTTGILMVFYLYLVLHPHRIRRSGFFCGGVAGLALVLLANFFGRALGVFGAVLHCLGLLAAFGGAVGACLPSAPPLVGGSRPGAPEESSPKADRPSQAAEAPRE